MGKRGDALRAEVVDALRLADGSLTAYEVLDKLRDAYPKIAPMSVYRTLNSLIEIGRVHRIESLNAYVLCQDHQDGHEAIMSICDDCGSVEETVAPEVLDSMTKAVGKSGFAPTRHVVEVHGTCADCVPDKSSA